MPRALRGRRPCSDCRPPLHWLQAWTFCSNPGGCGSGCSAFVALTPKREHAAAMQLRAPLLHSVLKQAMARAVVCCRSVWGQHPSGQYQPAHPSVRAVHVPIHQQWVPLQLWHGWSHSWQHRRLALWHVQPEACARPGGADLPGHSSRYAGARAGRPLQPSWRLTWPHACAAWRQQQPESPHPHCVRCCWPPRATLRRQRQRVGVRHRPAAQDMPRPQHVGLRRLPGCKRQHGMLCVCLGRACAPTERAEPPVAGWHGHAAGLRAVRWVP
jgi:hypothetical protein